jgi:hypothetical protein
LNRYASTNVRGSAIERSRNRQRKLNGIVNWYFDHIMEFLPLMLQAALLLFGCALSRYLWEIDTTVASVAIGATSCGIVLYIVIVAAGSVSVGCPYQTPGSRVLRSISSTVSSSTLVISSALGRAITRSETAEMFWLNVRIHHPQWSGTNIKAFMKDVLRELLPSLVTDARRLGRVVVWRSAIVFRRAYVLSPGSSSPLLRDQQATRLDLHCIAWVLHTSLDKGDHLSTLKYLTTIVPMAGFDPTLVLDCFNVLVDCANVIDSYVMTAGGSDQLEAVSAMCLLHTLSHLSPSGRTSTPLVDVRSRYRRAFPSHARNSGHPLYHTLGAIHSALHPDRNHRWFDWTGYGPTAYEHAVTARALARLTRSEHQREERRKVPRWILRFALHSLSQDPPPETSIVADCLWIIAIDLECDISEERTRGLHER